MLNLFEFSKFLLQKKNSDQILHQESANFISLGSVTFFSLYSLKTDYLDKLDSDEFLRFVGQYKFTLAFENAVCDDYITEKLWRPLIVGSIPIYYGSPSFKVKL